MSRTIVSLVVGMLIHTNTVWGGLLVQGFDPARHDRFYQGPDKAFIGEDYDFSGVARAPQTDGRSKSMLWATMISDSYFLTANHIVRDAVIGTNLRFYHGNDPDGSFEEHTVVSGQQIGNSDIWLGKLSTPVTSQVAKYRIPAMKLSDALGSEIHIFGLANGEGNPQYHWTTNMRMGRNVIHRTGTLSGKYQGAAGFQWFYGENGGGLGDDEAMTIGGDSGAPSFLTVGNEPTLLGVHNSVLTDAFVPSMIDEIKAAMVGESLSVLSLKNPEPTTAVLAILGIIIVFSQRRAGKRR